jgi:S-adenosylmethionine hydrolase
MTRDDSGPHPPLWRPLPRRNLLVATDFGSGSLYVGQLHAVLARRPPAIPLIDLAHDLPPFAPRAAGVLLAALWPFLPPDSLLLAVVDPGVGGARDAVVIEHPLLTCVGPDNGLFAPLLARLGGSARTFRLAIPEDLPAVSFHGRDLFAPAAVALLEGRVPALGERPPLVVGPGREEDLDEIVFIDRYGNATTGRRASTRHTGDRLLLGGGRSLGHARVFEEAHGPFWYANSLGLVEIACPRASAADLLGLRVGQTVAWLSTAEAGPQVGD